MTLRLIGTVGCAFVGLSFSSQIVLAQPRGEGSVVPKPENGPPINFNPIQIFLNRPDGGSEVKVNPSSPQPKPSTDSLLERGPQFPVTLSIGSFTVEGFTRGGWPFVIDFLPQPDSCTWLAVSTGEKSYAGILLDMDGHAGRHVAKVNLPDEIGPNPRPGEYIVYSERQACTSTTGGGQQAARPFSPIAVYGIGAGPRAVGSVAINNVQFGPPTPRFPQESATFGYNTVNFFVRASEEILRFEETGEGQWSVGVVHATQLDALPHGPHRGSWDGKDGGGERKPGIYHLQVRVWNTLNDEKSWGGALSPDSVHIVKP
ncbi:hypothetical protein [Paraburkholderia sp. BL10I2N1]|uniref:hypothetical protein n=1 Tax=Paraburkholderia sp. BL10I2N1 TaxID=1938796 RepID=UPI0010619822|nr:hypothetical protein [Paraburkholderia sp. BL10I2N1]TDN62263.1 hypothetical protein B0G77_5811 [Paraburkholderia sp. BL10I2N1]